MRKPWRWALGVLVVSIASAWILTTPVTEAPASTGAPKRPKLVVLLVFDQLRGDYLKKWQPLFGEGGFKRLQTGGAWFTDCHYPYAYTLTAPGHTSLVTGTTPDKHGIVANDWYDRADRETVSSVTPPAEEFKNGRGPYRRHAESVGEVLMRMLGRVFAVSIKDRSAILMAALRDSVCYWFNSGTGHFVTSAYYRADPHPWVTKFNKQRHADRWLDKNWDRFNPKLDYAKHSGPDDFTSEGIGYAQGQTFPHPFKLGATDDADLNMQSYREAVACSPMGNDLVLAFTQAMIVNEKIGQTDKTDLLCISFSSNDLVGHCWGPDSQEVLDMTLRSDAQVKTLLDFLDAKVGKGNYYVAVSADHGVCPLPEFAAKEGKDAGRVEPNILTSKALAFLDQKFLPKGETAAWFEQPNKSNAWVYFNQATLKELKIASSDAESALAAWFKAQPGIAGAFTRTELTAGKVREPAEMCRQMQRSFHPDGSGDVMVVLKPYHLFSSPILTKNPDKYPAFRTSHGTPHEYDTHVPLLAMGPRIHPGARGERIAPQVMASILAEALGVPPPKNATYAVPAGLFK